MDLVNNADSAVQSYWTNIHNDQIHAPPKFKGFNYKPSASSAIILSLSLSVAAVTPISAVAKSISLSSLLSSAAVLILAVALSSSSVVALIPVALLSSSVAV
ncbi:3177_t:CDS:2, partial [Funneliformis geosporum]